MSNIFERASRLKLQFDTPKGSLSVEDLWDLQLTSTTGKANLDDLAREYHNQLKNNDDVSFVTPAQKSDEVVQLKFDLVKHIIDVKILERDAATVRAENKARKQKILGIIEQKKDAAMSAASIEELERELAGL